MFGANPFGTAAFGTPKPSSPVSGFVAYLAGAPLPATRVAEQLEILDAIDQRGTADLTVVDYAGGDPILPGTRVDVVEDGIALFRGSVERVVETVIPVNSGGATGRARQSELLAVDFSQIADRRAIVSRVDFAAQPAGDIVTSLVTSYLAGEGLSTRGVQPSSRVTAAFELTSVADAFTQLGQVTGDSWRVDANRDLAFGPRTLAPAPFSLTDSTPLLERVQVERSRERFRTVQIIRGFTSAFEVDSCDTLVNWVASRTEVISHRVVIASGSIPSSESIALGTAWNGYAYRPIAISETARLRWDMSQTTLPGSTATAWVAYFLGVSPDGQGPAMRMTYGPGAAATSWGLTQANCWTNVDTPTVAISGTGAWGLIWNTVQVSITAGRWRVTISNSIAGAQNSDTLEAAYAPFGRHFGAATFTANSADNGPRALMTEDVTWSTSVGVPYVASRASASAISSAQAREGGTGQYYALERLPEGTLATSQQILDRADGAVRRFGVMPDTLTFETTEPGLRAGQRLPVHLTMFGITEDYLVTQVRITRAEGVPATRYAVTAVSDEQQGGPGDFFKGLAR